MRAELGDDAAAPAPAKAGDDVAQHLLIQSAFNLAGDVIERVADVGRQPRRPSLDPANIEAEFATIFDPKWRAMGERGRNVVIQNSGALQRTVDALEVLLWMPSTIKPRYQQVASPL